MLFDAGAGYASKVGVLGATTGTRIKVQGYALIFDPRLQATYATSATDRYRDSFGMGVSANSESARVAATLGLTYPPQASGLSMTLRAGGAVVSYDTTVDTSDDTSASTATTTNHRQDQVFTTSFDASWALGAQSVLSGSITSDSGRDTKTLRGAMTFDLAF